MSFDLCGRASNVWNVVSILNETSQCVTSQLSGYYISSLFPPAFQQHTQFHKTVYFHQERVSKRK
jgi:hypothetical protein